MPLKKEVIASCISGELKLPTAVAAGSPRKNRSSEVLEIALHGCMKIVTSKNDSTKVVTKERTDFAPPTILHVFRAFEQRNKVGFEIVGSTFRRFEVRQSAI
jgi:hypothetical protein